MHQLETNVTKTFVLDKGPSGLKVLVPININVKTSLLLQYRQELEDYDLNVAFLSKK